MGLLPHQRAGAYPRARSILLGQSRTPWVRFQPQGGKAVLADSETEIRRLRQALTGAEMARDILKKR